MNLIYLDNDFDVQLSGARKRDTGAYLTGAAVVTYTLERLDNGTPVASGSLSYVAASSGDFLAKIDRAALAALVERDEYLLTVSASQDGYDGEWTQVFVARRRGNS